MKSLQNWLDHCERIHPVTIQMGLERVADVAARMKLKFRCPVITVAGTNGKGSTCAFIEHIARNGDQRTGVYSSPHLLRFEERCRIDGAPARSDALTFHFERVEAARQSVSLTYFEFTTLAILSFMAASQLDLAILEVGLGGRQDAVNIIDADCAVITAIDLDHMNFLGPDRESIGREKAGIMRAGCPVVVSDPRPPSSAITYAHQIGAPMSLMGRDFHIRVREHDWDWFGVHASWCELPRPALRGYHQYFNASGALAAVDALRARMPLSKSAISAGLSQAAIPGRFQVVMARPTCIFDLAHNPHGAESLTATLQTFRRPGQRLHAVFGAMKDKDFSQILATVNPLVDH